MRLVEIYPTIHLRADAAELAGDEVNHRRGSEVFDT